ncbi:glycosyltransferase family 4 protein [Thermomonas fusca]|uniref:glycosyltransferase family 4 protein n=1 Tax=Thermomonas fusca TaxID=215690 RepID=UPI00056EA7DC|nr:glycosyltransferase family 4 protein [Thermomonas fusca]
MRQNRVLLIASFAESVTKFRGPLIQAIRSSGASVDIAGPGVGTLPELRDAMGGLGVGFHDLPLRRTGTNPFADINLFLSILRLIRRRSPTATLPYTIKPVIYGTLAAWIARVPGRYALISGLGYAFTGSRGGVLTKLVHGLYRFALSKTHKVFFQNPDDERLFRKLGILPESVPSVVVSGSGVDVGCYAFQPIAGQARQFLMIARLLGDKGVREFTAAARRIKTSVPGVRFQLVGWIDSNPDAIPQAELDAWIAEGAIEFLGKLDDVRPAIAASTVYVLPSYREGTPRTVLEAMAMGRPIITTDAPGCRETVIDGENGFLVPVKSVDALVEAMLKFIGDPTLAPRMGRRSREIAEEKYDVHKVNAVMLREMGIAPPQDENAHAA